MQRTALLTGYSGFLGRHVLDLLINGGWRVLLAGRAKPTDDRCNAYISIELTRPETLAPLREITGIDSVIHLASRIVLSDTSDSNLLAPNVLSTGFLAQMSAEWGAHLVFASTAIVHGAADKSITMSSPIVPDTPYGRSKWLGEELIGAAGTKHCILRMGGVFGLAGSQHLGLNKAIMSAISGVSPTRIGQGTALRNYLFVKDAAASVVAAAAQGTEGTHLLAGPEVLTIRAMLAQICATLNPNSSPLEMDGQEARDQVIERSPAFGSGISFSTALRDIADEAQTCVSG